MSFFSKFWTWLRGVVATVVAALHPYLSAYAANLQAVGIKDVVGFLKAAEPVALAAGAAAISSGGSGAAVLSAVSQALVPVAVQYGAVATHDALNAVLNTTAELIHQPAVAERVESVPSDAAKTVGTTPPG